MPFSNEPIEGSLRDRMTAALELAWVAVSWDVHGLLPSDRAEMAQAISCAAAEGERDFACLQQRAINVLAARGVVSGAVPVERRKEPRPEGLSAETEQRGVARRASPSNSTVVPFKRPSC